MPEGQHRHGPRVETHAVGHGTKIDLPICWKPFRSLVGVHGEGAPEMRKAGEDRTSGLGAEAGVQWCRAAASPQGAAACNGPPFHACR